MNVHTPLIPEKVLTSKENDNYTDLVLHHPLLPSPPPSGLSEREVFQLQCSTEMIMHKIKEKQSWNYSS